MGVRCYTIEIFEKLFSEAEPKLKKLYPELVTAKLGDGFYGWEEAAPFDAIVVTAGIAQVPEYLANQIKLGCHIIIPIDNGKNDGGHVLEKYTRTAKGFNRQQVSHCCFVPFTKEVNGKVVNRNG